ncbi:alpha-1,2-fucosyltransferase [Spirochaetia bacterium]|nr:alpha-1,2-fucosyltransferase [Spirochaetia bacterium]
MKVPSIIKKIPGYYFLRESFIYFKTLFSYVFLNQREKDEIIVYIDGGLTSQMYQYTMGQEIERITGISVGYDVTWFETCGKDLNGIANRPLKLEKAFPSIKINKASKEKIKIYKILFNKYNQKVLVQNLDNIDLTKPPIYLGGYWSSKKYTNFDNDYLQNKFIFKLNLDQKNSRVFTEIQHCVCSVALHIRLGDFIGSIHEVITPQYFFNAIKLITNMILPERPHFFVFSNDIEKCKTNIITSDISGHFNFVDINDEANGEYDLFLMSHCHHFIISNSGFGMYAALLSKRSKNKIVIQPNKNWKAQTETNRPSYPGWIVMDC